MRVRLQQLEGELIAGRFRLGQMIGKGGYGAVFDAEQTSMGRRCAVKILLPWRADDPTVEKRFRAEARTTSRLNHPHTVVVYDFGVDESTGFLFLATEYLDGANLHQVLKCEETLSVRRTLSILEQVGSSLADAHDQGLVHRDVKPKNIMLVQRAGQNEFVKVIDFGIAKALEGELAQEMDLTQTGMLIGTPQYLAPEFLLGNRIDGRADQYALALVGYRMLTGHNPFKASGAVETAMRHVNDDPLPLRAYRRQLDVSRRFEQVFLKAMEKDPEHRHDTTLDFVNALGDAADLAPEGDGTRRRQSADDDIADRKTLLLDSVGGEETTDDIDQFRTIPTEGVTPLGAGADSIGDDEGDTTTEFNGGAEEGSRAEDVGNGEETLRETPSPKRGPAAADDTPGTSRADDVQRCGCPPSSRTETPVPVSDQPRKTPGPTRRRWLIVVSAGSALLFAAAVIILLVAPSPSGDGGANSTDGDGAEFAAGGAVDEDRTSSGEDDKSQRSAAAIKRCLVDSEIAVGRATAVARGTHGAGGVSTDAAAIADAVAEARRRPATITVTLIPWGRLYVNGQPHSDQIRQKVTVEPGRHRLTLRQHDQRRASRVVDVEPGQSKMVTLEADFTD